MECYPVVACAIYSYALGAAGIKAKIVFADTQVAYFNPSAKPDCKSAARRACRRKPAVSAGLPGCAVYYYTAVAWSIIFFRKIGSSQGKSNRPRKKKHKQNVSCFHKFSPYVLSF
jgi:hypothetical protein